VELTPKFVLDQPCRAGMERLKCMRLGDVGGVATMEEAMARRMRTREVMGCILMKIINGDGFNESNLVV